MSQLCWTKSEPFSGKSRCRLLTARRRGGGQKSASRIPTPTPSPPLADNQSRKNLHLRKGGREKFLKKVYIFADFAISEPSHPVNHFVDKRFLL
ncbi:MAG: hypothetical protein AUK07_00425 [Parcubacteria group bacterium CG2_30_36_21]|nr:MAG: hypothetical protein AUK07_00425 [Parcubacteria group bacterium CG2_30_36_21]